MSGTKGFLKSRTVWASLVGIGFALLDTFSVDPGVSEGEALEMVWKAGEVIAFAVAIWGRVVAVKAIGAT